MVQHAQKPTTTMMMATTIMAMACDCDCELQWCIHAFRLVNFAAIGRGHWFGDVSFQYEYETLRTTRAQ